eukprot:18793-Chlamydomonas_euryale.AAC.1
MAFAPRPQPRSRCPACLHARQGGGLALHRGAWVRGLPQLPSDTYQPIHNPPLLFHTHTPSPFSLRAAGGADARRAPRRALRDASGRQAAKGRHTAAADATAGGALGRVRRRPGLKQ